MRSHSAKLRATSRAHEGSVCPGLRGCAAATPFPETLRSFVAAPPIATDPGPAPEWEIHAVAAFDEEDGPVMRFAVVSREGHRRPSGAADGLFANIAAAQAAIPKRRH